MLKDIVLHLSPDTKSVPTAASRYACALAAAHGARLTALVYGIDVTVPVMGAGFAPGAPTFPPLPDDRAEAEATASAFLAFAERQSVSVETVVERNAAFGIGQTLADYARVRDLTVMDAEPRSSTGRRFLIEAALFDSARPLLLVPSTAAPQPPQRALVAWDASPASVRAVNDALPLLKRCSHVEVVSVNGDKEVRLDQSGVELAKHLARHDIHAAFAGVAPEGRSIGVVLADVARREQADLLVMGGFAHSRLRGLVLGSATREIIHHGFPVPTLLSH
jgi:nucleotide-binding universal stress UspA family protein